MPAKHALLHQRKKEDLGKRLDALLTQVSQLAESMNDVRRDVANIDRSVTDRGSGETTPSPEQQRGYRYPFSSPIQQVATRQVSTSPSYKIANPARQISVSPSREATQIVETSTENTPVTARSEMSPRREIIWIESSPDPIAQKTIAALPPRRSKRNRDTRRAAARKAKDIGGNNMMEDGDRGLRDLVRWPQQAM
ncbi:hypothetical protein PENPOL_c011G01570 [Penicillium polonicum]|uniref:Uncharacterized protein n=1 Tax=Penicillium polonicum TaxID=60169 RepID=A0A1V6NDP9_PENPO|nr:hypothetical protein PENPOL_c011G01570 [Penicillium polonicum]